MSTVADVLNDAGALVLALEGLIATDTAQQVPQIATDLGVHDQLVRGLTKATDLLRTVGNDLQPIKKALVLADAFLAIGAVVPPVITQLSAIARDADNDLSDIGINISGIATGADAAGQAIGTIGRTLRVGTDFAEGTLAYAGPGEFSRLLADLDRLAKDLDGLKQPPPTPAPANAAPAL